MPTVVALLVDRQDRERVGPLLRAFGDVRFGQRPIELWQALADENVLGVIATLRDGDGRPVSPTAAELARLLPTLPVIVIHSATNNSADQQELAALALIRGVTVVDGQSGAALSKVLQDRLSAARVQSPAAAMLEAVSAVDPPLNPLIDKYLRAIILHARWPLRVPAVMDVIDSSTRVRTLYAYLRLANLPSPEKCIGWTFTLRTAWLLTLPGWTFDAVASRLGFNDSNTLRGVFKHQAGMAPIAAMNAGGFAHLLGRFERLLRGDWSHEPYKRSAGSSATRSRKGS